MLGKHPSIVIPPGSAYAKEMCLHEATFTQFGAPGRPFVYREFPKRIYKAVRGESGVTLDGYTVNDEDEQRNMQSRGYSLTQQDALDALEREQTEHGKLAAERAWEVAHGRLSARAAEEVAAAEQAHGARHLPAVPETPIAPRKKPGPKPKAETVPV